MKKIPVNEPRIYNDELIYVTEAITSGWISSESTYVRNFEEKFAEITNRKHAIAVSNGTAALEIAIKALGIGPGDEVIMPTFTIISCAQAVVKVGALPIFVDSDLSTWNINVEEIESKITPATKAIMMVHIYGLPSDVDGITRIAKKYNLKVIEDAAEAIGLEYKSEPCGSFGDISTMSLYANKHITTGEGGMILTNDLELSEKSKYYRNLCFNKERRFLHYDLGWNYRLSGIQAAFGLGQLLNLNKTLARKKEIGALYDSLLDDNDTFSKPIKSLPYAENNYWVYGIVLSPKRDLNALRLSELLSENGIETRPFFYPMHLQPVFLKMQIFGHQNYPKSETLAEYGLYLPSGTATTNSEINEVAKQVNRLMKES
jgi:perosamine synthetase